MRQKKYDIFISYRRDNGGKELARILYGELRKRKYSVFLDCEELIDGTFGPQIYDAINSAKLFLFILSANSLNRCNEEDDWVRQEILYAIKCKKHIVPINVDGAFTTFPCDIPSEIIKALGDEQQTEIHLGHLFDVSIKKLVNERIRPYVNNSRIIFFRNIFLILTISILGFVIYSHQYVTQDINVYNAILLRASLSLNNVDSLEEASLLLLRADSLHSKYEGTLYEKKFNNDSRNMMLQVNHLKDSLFMDYKSAYEFWYKQYLTNLNDIENKQKAKMYIDKALAIKYDENLMLMKKILSE